ncbi:hypothetical protein GIB67_039610 [Kingdonia uniflora]|uniref:Fatty acid hydroxylase domain-containing protein n=1 Tax=Kingdonia uniflora TaxID=39325 RepID=A0A7J7P700_9MAGN|nr:hypothetical protein GIB67_039610 [Kingdonia uniflora]
MLAYQSLQEAELSLGRELTYAETIWFNYSANKSDYFLFCHNIIFLFFVFSLVPLPVLLMELKMSKKNVDKFKIQPKVRIPKADMFRCYKDVMMMFFFVVGPLQLVSYPVIKVFHCKWGYDKIHRVHHEFTAPIGFAAPYAHWAEVLVLGIPSFLGPAIVPGHMITFWLWIILRQIEAIETHSGYAYSLALFHHSLSSFSSILLGQLLPIEFSVCNG